jgi:HlyD family secretion protein
LSARPRLVWLLGGLGLLVVILLVAILRRPSAPTKPVAPTAEAVRPPEAVAALGQLEPAGDVRRLAAPVSGFGGTPRVAELLVKEGDAVAQGDVLARFDSRPQILADLAAVREKLRTLDIQIRMGKREVSRYAAAAREGAAALVLLEDKQDDLVRLEGERREALARERKLKADLADSELRSPIDGVVLKLHTRVGERSSADGVLEVGASQQMEALIEVYESDVNRIRLGQPVALVSENGGFSGRLTGEVVRISPQVRQRRVLSTDPTGDADARIVEVRVRLTPESAAKVSRLAGMKVIARFQNP